MFIGKTLMLGKIEAGAEGDDRGWDGWMASRLDRCEFEQALGDGGGQAGLAGCGPRGHQASDTAERLDDSKGLQRRRQRLTQL